MIGTVIETKELLQAVASSLVAGVGITTAFAVLIFGVARSADMVRDERPLLATAAGTLAVLALVVVIASIVLGIVVMTSK